MPEDIQDASPTTCHGCCDPWESHWFGEMGMDQKRQVLGSAYQAHMLTQNHTAGRNSTESRNTGSCELSIRFC